MSMCACSFKELKTTITKPMPNEVVRQSTEFDFPI